MFLEAPPFPSRLPRMTSSSLYEEKQRESEANSTRTTKREAFLTQRVPHSPRYFGLPQDRCDSSFRLVTLQRPSSSVFDQTCPAVQVLLIFNTKSTSLTYTLDLPDYCEFLFEDNPTLPSSRMYRENKIVVVQPFSRDPLDGLNSGVPTRTTSTLTPTTLRSVEQFVEIPVHVEAHQNQARFIPPIIQTTSNAVKTPKTTNVLNVVGTKSWQGGCTRVAEPSTFTAEVVTKSTPPQNRRNTGGRKPNRDKSISPEEEERRKVRRERNKLAAARCRKRRLDHTNELLMETDELQEKKQGLQNEIQMLQSKKEELEFLLENHQCCKMLDRPNSPEDVKPFVAVKKEDDFPEVKPFPKSVGKRPTSLPVPSVNSSSDGITYNTPSTGINFNFDSLMEGGTGMTPVSGPLIPSVQCSVQQRNSGCGDLSSPDSVTTKNLYDLFLINNSAPDKA